MLFFEVLHETYVASIPPRPRVLVLHSAAEFNSSRSVKESPSLGGSSAAPEFRSCHQALIPILTLLLGGELPTNRLGG